MNIRRIETGGKEQTVPILHLSEKRIYFAKSTSEAEFRNAKPRYLKPVTLNL
jgi:hypothetical protein